MSHETRPVGGEDASATDTAVKSAPATDIESAEALPADLQDERLIASQGVRGWLSATVSRLRSGDPRLVAGRRRPGHHLGDLPGAQPGLPLRRQPGQPDPAECCGGHDCRRGRPGPAPRRDRPLGRVDERPGRCDPRRDLRQPGVAPGNGRPGGAGLRRACRPLLRGRLQPLRCPELRHHPLWVACPAGDAAARARQAGAPSTFPSRPSSCSSPTGGSCPPGCPTCSPCSPRWPTCSRASA